MEYTNKTSENGKKKESCGTLKRMVFTKHWILLTLALVTFYISCTESTPLSYWNQEVARRRLHPTYKCTGKLRIACARVAKRCHVPVPTRRKQDIIEWMKTAANEIEHLERRRAHREAGPFSGDISPMLVERLHEMESDSQLRYSENQWLRVKVSCKRCDDLCWV